MKFRNIAPAGLPLSFDIDERHYDVPPGAVFEVPDHVAFAVTKMGVLAAPVDSELEALEKATRPDAAPVDSAPESAPKKKS